MLECSSLLVVKPKLHLQSILKKKSAKGFLRVEWEYVTVPLELECGKIIKETSLQEIRSRIDETFK